MLPAVGQGALAIECRCDDRETLELLAALEDRGTRLTTACERAVLRALGADCTLPVAAHAQLHGDTMTAKAWVFAGGHHHHADARATCEVESDARTLGETLAAMLPRIDK
jgi:hydroxymethylbilane synthase